MEFSRLHAGHCKNVEWLCAYLWMPLLASQHELCIRKGAAVARLVSRIQYENMAEDTLKRSVSEDVHWLLQVITVCVPDQEVRWSVHRNGFMCQEECFEKLLRDIFGLDLTRSNKICCLPGCCNDILLSAIADCD